MTIQELKVLSVSYFERYPETTVFYAVEDGNFFEGSKKDSAKHYAHLTKQELHTIKKEEVIIKVDGNKVNPVTTKEETIEPTLDKTTNNVSGKKKERKNKATSKKDNNK